jgi:hypothetical protein
MQKDDGLGLSEWWDDSVPSQDEMQLVSKKIMEFEALWRTREARGIDASRPRGGSSDSVKQHSKRSTRSHYMHSNSHRDPLSAILRRISPNELPFFVGHAFTVHECTLSLLVNWHAPASTVLNLC